MSKNYNKIPKSAFISFQGAENMLMNGNNPLHYIDRYLDCLTFVITFPLILVIPVILGIPVIQLTPITQVSIYDLPTLIVFPFKQL